MLKLGACTAAGATTAGVGETHAEAPAVRAQANAQVSRRSMRRQDIGNIVDDDLEVAVEKDDVAPVEAVLEVVR